jgi:hypothetical protein
MYEVIISNINTGRVWRKLFETRDGAERHEERFFDGPHGTRSRRNYRVEVHHRPAPVVRRVVGPAVVEEAA